ncbi:MAG: T9SS type A sorting domain-containing protein [Bacteroidales bacterium]|nr:T9SS type A sorting domain-containing protein [Bacteroidales bacterium]MCF8399033.1 T9SS type A sorting domain-containing protein [Bacteroidales bacterium]
MKTKLIIFSMLIFNSNLLLSQQIPFSNSEINNTDLFIDSVIIRYSLHKDQQWIFEYNEFGNISGKIIKVLDNGVFRTSGYNIYQYNQEQQMIEELRLHLNDTIWENSFRTTYEYHDGNRTRYTTQWWYEGDWVYLYDNHYTYDENANLVLYEQLGFHVDHWEYMHKEDYSYNSMNLLDSLNNYYYIEEDSVWRHNNYEKYHYDENANMTEKLKYSSPDSGWKAFVKRKYDYDSSDQLISEKYLHNSDTMWININRRDYEYDGSGNIITMLKFLGEDTLWHYGMKYEMNYDEFNNKSSEYRYVFDNSDSSWNYEHFNDYYHDYVNNFSSVSSYLWDDGEWISFSDFDLNFNLFGYLIVQHAIAHYAECNYSGLLAGNYMEKAHQNSFLKLYPNPAQNHAYLNLNPVVSNGRILIELFDLQGRRIKQIQNVKISPNSEEIKIDLSGLNSGVILVRLVSDQGVQQGKLVKY